MCGNSLGWYTAVALSGAVSFEDGLAMVMTTSGYQRDHAQVGGQLVYPTMGDEWHESTELSGAIAGALMAAKRAGGYASVSIELGGATVLAADDAGMAALQASLPSLSRGRIKYPLVLPGHSAFHTPLMGSMQAALEPVAPAFAPPALPIFDGSGRLWPASAACDVDALRDYTVREQLLTPYYFGRSLEAAIEALDPEVLVLLGPGSSLGGAIGQTLSRMRWRGVTSKASFAALQASDSPALVVAGQTMP